MFIFMLLFVMGAVSPAVTPLRSSPLARLEDVRNLRQPGVGFEPGAGVTSSLATPGAASCALQG